MTSPTMDEDGSMRAPVQVLHPLRLERERTSILGMVIFIGSWVMLFMALFFVFAMFRAKEPVWPPFGVEAVPLGLPILNTFIIALSSVLLHRGIRDFAADQRSKALWGIGAAAALGALFMGLQIQLWSSVWASGLELSTHLYASFFYGLTAVHAVHVLVGWALLIWLVAMVRGVPQVNHALRARLIGMFWHFVGAVWMALFLLVFP